MFELHFFMFNLNMPCWTSKSQLERITWTIGANFPFLRLSTWTWIVIKIIYHFWMLKKSHLYIGDK
jgi:hypothetical protein